VSAQPASALPRVYLIRHGETAWSLSGQHTGRTDIALTEQGEQQARALAPILGAVTFEHVFVSPRQRARQTCDLAGLGATAQVAGDLAEWDYGDYEGLRSDEIRRRRADWSIYRDGCAGGEMPAQVTARVDRLLARLRTLRGNVALFTHGHVGAAIGARWIELPLVEARHLSLATASLGILAHDQRHDNVPVLALWNATALRP
jgi:broad specificity phosphatase PhoE